MIWSKLSSSRFGMALVFMDILSGVLADILLNILVHAIVVLLFLV